MEKDKKQETKEQLRQKKQTYITLEELVKILGEIPYIEIVNIIRELVNDGTIKAIRKKQEWQNTITFFKI